MLQERLIPEGVAQGGQPDVKKPVAKRPLHLLSLQSCARLLCEVALLSPLLTDPEYAEVRARLESYAKDGF